MYLDAIIVLALVIFVFCWFRKFSKFVEAWAIVDIFLRIIHFVANNIGISEFAKWTNNTLPESIPGIISKYSSGVIEFILTWIYVILMAIFLYYTIHRLIKKK